MNAHPTSNHIVAAFAAAAASTLLMGSQFGAWARKRVAEFQRRRVADAAERALRSLPLHTLRDIGLHPSEISYAAAELERDVGAATTGLSNAPWNSQPTSTRIAAAFAAVLTTALLIGSQLGLAEHYSSAADTTLAARQQAQVAQGTGAALTRLPRT